jgi:hypothetical protein
MRFRPYPMGLARNDGKTLACAGHVLQSGMTGNSGI